MKDAFLNLLNDSNLLASKLPFLKNQLRELKLENQKLTEQAQLLSKANNQLTDSQVVISKLVKNQKEIINEVTFKNTELSRQNAILKNDLSKFMQSSLNLDNLLSCQKGVFDKAGLGYQKDKNVVCYKNFFVPEKQKKHISFKRSETDYPHGRKPKRTGTNPKGPKMIWVPKCILPTDTGMHASSKDKIRMVSRQWLLKAYDRRKELVPNPVTC